VFFELNTHRLLLVKMIAYFDVHVQRYQLLSDLLKLHTLFYHLDELV
jgi:hypothetical protein